MWIIQGSVRKKGILRVLVKSMEQVEKGLVPESEKSWSEVGKGLRLYVSLLETIPHLTFLYQ